MGHGGKKPLDFGDNPDHVTDRVTVTKRSYGRDRSAKYSAWMHAIRRLL